MVERLRRQSFMSACVRLRRGYARLTSSVLLLVVWLLVTAACAQAAVAPATESIAPATQGSASATTDAPVAVGMGPDTTLLHSVFMTAMEFLSPRTLQPHTARQFSLWGLGGIGALDPALHVAEGPDGLVLMQGQDVLIRRPVPLETDVGAWADVVTDLLAAAWQHSDTLRTAGQTGLTQSVFDEIFNHLDPYSRYVAPAPAETDRTRRSGAQAGLGLAVTESTVEMPSHSGGRTRSGRAFVVSAVNTNGPAWPAGVDVGDHILAVNGRSVTGRSATEVRDMLEGEEGSRVSVRFFSPVSHRMRTLTFQRARVPPETVFAFSSGSMVILRLTSFSSETAEEMSQYLDQATQDRHLRGVVLDLRGNRGGVLQQAVTAAALLLDNGVAAITKGRDPQANHVWAVQGGDMLNHLPVVVLVDGRTASAAEILAAALADHRRAVVVGSSTLGKGLVQTVAQLPDRGELFVTWSRVIAPLGWPLQGLGVMPQLCTSRGALDSERQLKALEAGKAADSSAVLASRNVRYPVGVSRILDIRKACPAALGSDLDLELARSLIENHTAYSAALAMMPEDTGLEEAAAE
ncbi:PDZ domain-containing protein [Acetobacter estunensis]|nr:PDZ domain-containing protein [Acetobacter estunensis]MBV1835889.1 PDZ domain-containing protein [Acetobacter estunensis]